MYGSFIKQSKKALAFLFFCKKLNKSFSLIIAPLDVLIKIKSFLEIFKFFLLIKKCVDLFKSIFNEIISHFLKISFKLVFLNFKDCLIFFFSKTRKLQSKIFKYFLKILPIFPYPIRPTVLLDKFLPIIGFHLFFLINYYYQEHSLRNLK